jgi:hypothetical protein
MAASQKEKTIAIVVLDIHNMMIPAAPPNFHKNHKPR